MCCRQLASEAFEIEHKVREGLVEVAVMALLQQRAFDGFGECPQHVVGFAVVDDQTQHGQRIGCAMLLIRNRRAVRGRKTQLEDEIGLWPGHSTNWNSLRVLRAA